MLQDRRRLRIAALLEWAKAVLVAMAAAGALAALSPAQRDAVRAVLDRFHFSGRSEVEAAWSAGFAGLADERQLVAVIAVVYVLVRVVEGLGLWFGRAWARWLGIVSCAAYLVVEAWHFAAHPGWLGAGAIALTLGLLWLLKPVAASRDAASS